MLPPGKAKPRGARPCSRSGTWFFSGGRTGRPDDRFHLFQVVFQRAPASRSQLEFRSRLAPNERLCTAYVSRLFELAGMDTQVPVGDLQQSLEIVERERVVDRERADDAQSNAFVDYRIESQRLGASVPPGRGTRSPR